MEVKGHNIGVAGLGNRTGVSLVKYLCAHQASVHVYDARKESELTDSLNELKGLSFTLECGTETPKRLVESEMILVSPGVPIGKPYLEKARELGVKVISEVEFSSHLLNSPLIAITGTNGKSTTTELLGKILKSWDKKTFVGGNLGTPLIDAVDRLFDFVVAEISSFQLEGVDQFHPQVGILLNITPNHLDRHQSLENYVAEKAKLFRRMTQKDIALFNADDSSAIEISKRVTAQTFSFSLQKKADAYLDGEKICFRNGESFSIKNFLLQGAHNQSNALAASLAAHKMGCPSPIIEKGLSSFEGLPHRLEKVGVIDGVQFVNDSKSTTPDAALKAIQTFKRPIFWLAGGKGKKSEYSILKNVGKKEIAHAFFYGEAATDMAKELSHLPLSIHAKMEDAFSAACQEAHFGDVILLSPANASFDQFRDFEERGETYKKLVSSRLQRSGCH